MSRKPKRGYYVRGHFVAEGSELDLELKRQSKGDSDISKTDRKHASEALQKLGQDMLTLRTELFDALPISEKLRDALLESKRITQFEAKRRHLQFIGKLMRTLDESTVQAMQTALQIQQQGNPADAALLHQAEDWRERLLNESTHAHALQEWIIFAPSSDLQKLRALIRQARKDAGAQTPEPLEPKGAKNTPNSNRAYKALFQFIKSALDATTSDNG